MKSLQFEDKPDYAHLKKIIRNGIYKCCATGDKRFDWELVRNGEIDSEGNLRQIAEESKPTIRIPLATFIENERHYLKYKKKGKDQSVARSEDKSQISDSTTPRSQLSKIATLNITAKQNIKKYGPFYKK